MTCPRCNGSKKLTVFLKSLGEEIEIECPDCRACCHTPRYPKVCYLDLDGVLVDFIGGAERFHGVSLVDNDHGDSMWTKVGMTGDQFWGPLGADFWANLEWTLEGRELVERIIELFSVENVAILTSPPKTPGAVEGKVRWINKHLPQFRRQFAVCPAKHLFAGRGKVLVDDHDLNCVKFALRGGWGCLVNRPWNALGHEHGPIEPAERIAQTIKHLHKFLGTQP